MRITIPIVFQWNEREKLLYKFIRRKQELKFKINIKYEIIIH